MQFELSSEQQLLRDSVARFIAENYDATQRLALVKADEGGSGANWQGFAANGWLGAALPEQFSGFGGSAIETAIIGQQFGRGLVIEPYLGCAVLAGQTLLAAATPSQCDRWLPALIDGSQRLALAYSEPSSHGMPEIVETCAGHSPKGYVLHGRKTLVLGGPLVDGYIVSARLPSQPTSRGCVGLFLVRADAPGLSAMRLPLHDGTQAAEIVLDAVLAQEMLGDPDRGLQALREGLSHAMLSLCAELIGAMERTLEITAEYLRNRKQFNVPIASFQSLQHRMADMAAETELARSMLFVALASFFNDSANERYETVSSAKSFICGIARSVCAQSIQLHGGIGMTEEYSVGHYFKRAVVADVLLGTGTVREAAAAQQLQKRFSDARTGAIYARAP